MDIGKKIEEIRNKPEHIREKYVWLSVGICMVLIFGIWLFSFKTMFGKKEPVNSSAPVKELIEKSKETIGEMPSIGDLNQEAVAPVK